MGLLDKLRAVHDAAAREGVEVPEYGLTLYFPPLTVSDRTAIRRGINPDDDMELRVSALVHMAQTEDGAKAFEDTPAMRAELNRMPVSVLLRITAQSKGAAVGASTVKNA